MQRNIGLCSLNDPVDTTTSQGRLVFNIFAFLAEFERDMIRERTQAGLSDARARGRLDGRPKGIPKASEVTAIATETLYREGKLSVMQIAKRLSISKNTLYKYLRYRNVVISSYKPCQTDLKAASNGVGKDRRKNLTKLDKPLLAVSLHDPRREA
jgi:DNA invertase Pin-like site-specific DNA recombinase